MQIVHEESEFKSALRLCQGRAGRLLETVDFHRGVCRFSRAY